MRVPIGSCDDSGAPTSPLVFDRNDFRKICERVSSPQGCSACTRAFLWETRFGICHRHVLQRLGTLASTSCFPRVMLKPGWR